MDFYSASGDKNNLIWISPETRMSTELVICNKHNNCIFSKLFDTVINICDTFIYWACYKGVVVASLCAWLENMWYNKSLL